MADNYEGRDDDNWAKEGSQGEEKRREKQRNKERERGRKKIKRIDLGNSLLRTIRYHLI